MLSYKNLHSLEQSDDKESRMRYKLLLTLLSEIFGNCEGELMLTNELETDVNHEFMSVHWGSIKKLFSVPKSSIRSKRPVRQVIIGIMSDLLVKYDFEKPPRMLTIRKERMVDGKKTSTTYMLVSFV